MKNILISALATWIFWKEICVIQPIWILPVVFFVILAWIRCIEDEIREYQRRKRRGQSLARKIRRIGREVIY